MATTKRSIELPAHLWTTIKRFARHATSTTPGVRVGIWGAIELLVTEALRARGFKIDGANKKEG